MNKAAPPLTYRIDLDEIKARRVLSDNGDGPTFRRYLSENFDHARQTEILAALGLE